MAKERRNPGGEPDESGGDPDQKLIESVLRLPEFQSVAEDLADCSIELFVDNPAVDAIPVVKSVLGLVRFGIGYREALFAKKLLRMLYGIGEATEKDVQKWRERLAADSGERETGERVLAVVDRVTSAWKAELIGRVFRVYLDGGTDRAAFLHTVEVIDSALTGDLKSLVEESVGMQDREAFKRLLALGLAADPGRSEVHVGGQPRHLTPAGELLFGLPSR